MLEVVEPMGMETMVFFNDRGHRGLRAGRAVERAVARGNRCELYANLNHMHLIDPDTRLVL